MKKVILRAPVFTQSGYGVHARQLARFLLSKQDIDLRVQPLHWGSTPWITVGPDECIDALRDRVDPAPSGYDVSVQLQLPNEWDPKIATSNIGVTAAVETDRANPVWADHCASMDRVITPSKHAVASLIMAGARSEKICVVPESFPAAVLARQDTKLDIGVTDAAFGVLIVGQLTGSTTDTDRKNIFSAIKWSRQALRDDPNAVIIIKTNCGRNTAIDRMRTEAVLRNQAHIATPGPRVVLVHGSMSDEQMIALYKHRAVKCYVSLTRGEGFGLPTLEAAACDIPVIATDWSAHTEYMNLGKWTRVSYKLIEISKQRIDGTIFVTGAKWADPDEANFKAKLLKTRDSLRVPQDWARELGASIREKYSESAVRARFFEAVGDILC